MRKQVFGRQFKRDKNERKALFKTLLSSLVLSERIQTTEQKAKAIKGQADKLVTLAKKHKNNAHTLLADYLTHDAVRKLEKEIAPRFSQRQGGYTSLLRLGVRQSDRATMALLQWIEGAKPQAVESLKALPERGKEPVNKKAKTPRKRAIRKITK